MKLSIEVFTEFCRKYQKRYGDSRMDPKTSGMFFHHLSIMDEEQFTIITDALLGESQFAFGWKAVLNKKELRFPQADQDRKERESWKLEAHFEAGDEKQKHMSQVMQTIIKKIDRQRPGDDPLDWHLSYAKEFVETWGPKEALRTITKMINETQVTNEVRGMCVHACRIMVVELPENAAEQMPAL